MALMGEQSQGRGVSEISSWNQAPFCHAPSRIAHTHWMSHLPFAFWLIPVLRPRLLVELGTYTGVSFCAFCQQLDALNLSCQCYAVDLWQGDANMGQYDSAIFTDLADYVQAAYPGFASLLRMSFDDALTQFADSSIDLLHIDGYHSEEAMLHDFESWLPKMSARGVVLMHDIITRLPGYGGPAAWAKISSRFPHFAFTHGYGLGVVLVGDAAPQILREFAALPDFSVVGSVFQQQGKIYECLFAMERKIGRQAEAAAAREAALNHRITDLEGQLQKAKKYMQAQQLGHDDEVRKLKELQFQLKELHFQQILKLQACESSLSWKLTAPLRKLASLWHR